MDKDRWPMVKEIRQRIMCEAYDLADRDDSEGYNAIKVMCSDVIQLIDEMLDKLIEQAEKQEPVPWSTRERFYQALNEAVETTKERMFIKTITMRCKDYDIALPVINICDGHVVVGQGFTPPQRQPLHDMAVFDLADTHLYEGGKNYGVLAFARAIEAAHGIKGEA